jgi:hypothetical protein
MMAMAMAMTEIEAVVAGASRESLRALMQLA